MPTLRSIDQRRPLARQRMTPTFASYGLRSSPSFSLDPFLNLDDFEMSAPTFPPHPHAGFSAVTYLFEDSAGAFRNRDSLGDRSRIEPGALHWTQAAHGMLHEEVPEHPGEVCHGLQMFVNLADRHKSAKPAAFHASSREIPEARPSAGIRVRVLAGAFEGVASVLRDLLTPVTFLEIHAEADATVEIDVPPAHNAFVMTVRGRGTIVGAQVEAHEALLFSRDGDRIRITGGPGGLRCLFGAGAPIEEPVVFGGPFVMTRQADIERARERFARGEMGALSPSFGGAPSR
jgi:redox-sensitive bicupin YhaK (pirin superfamily)